MKTRTLLWLLASVLLVGAPAVAHAQAARRVLPPPDWHIDVDRAGRLAAFLGREEHFAGTPLDGSEVAVFSAPGGGAALIVSIVRAPAPPALAVAVRSELDAVRGASRAAALDGSPVQEIAWRERVNDAARAVEAILEWRHRGNQSLSISRTLIATRADGIERATAECVIREDLVATLREACTAALDSLAPGIPLEQRLAIALPAAHTPAPAATSNAEPPRLGDGSAIKMPAIPVERAEPKRDMRSLYVLGGLLVLAAFLIWSRQRRSAETSEKPPEDPGGEENR